ncbi:Protein NTM1-like 9 [Dichanthelium oligosanthes]|uniref:Protein NTM1-like 9 n=1 Tax=Dichanthelium oligosanthes TaxID=888268 RepID=A0A1E5VDL5_9POAL|nr:Protein NTM1-like 9 [Dichanthelium oligosanthes]
MPSPPPPPPPPGALPVGFCFRPTNEELVRHYLKPKIVGAAHPDLLLIPDVDLSACEPWDLPAKALIRSNDPEWFFFAPLDRKYPGGHRSNRCTTAGYWKATGKDRLIRSRPAGTLIGVKKTLVFHRGRAPRGHRTAWIMHEYRTAKP